MTMKSAQTPTRTSRSRGYSFRTKLAVIGSGAALVCAPMFVAGAANAAPGDPFAVTTPANNATGVEQTFPNVVPFTGTGLPDGDYASVSYLDATGGVHNATFSGSTNDNGDWTGSENFAELSKGQTHVVATVRAGTALSDGTFVPDTAVTPTTVTFDLAQAPNPANPFTVTTPTSNSTTPVESTTPTFSGTGNPGATITITYGARAGGTGTAATTTVDADGNWTTTTDFSELEPGTTDGSAIVTEYGTDGAVFPGTSGQRINFTFPAAPAPAVPLALVIDPTTLTLSTATTTGVDFAATGFSPNEEITIAVTDASGAAVVIPQDADHFYVDDETGSFVGTAVLPSTVGTGTYSITVTGVRSTRTVTSSFTVTADPAIPVTGGGTPVGTGTTVTGTALPVVAG
ncbi:hypothetical protein [Curtobacterium sp. Leaf261]|uniref:hypothetical protein n=1 Tax=Curtobacterium sp. Leaf261 TaxID=1736311 RepID=UPI0006F7DCB2|nr:hypothetical protein [Curtobacterium sp. Leaf261]KQO62778.1 hypothetical protein ASF23_07470 [Curtobacterium sp. Leaf261]